MLLALTARLFERVPLGRMPADEQALFEAADQIPVEVRARLETADKMSDEDREVIIQISRTSLAAFQSAPGPEKKA
jgi:F-type H+-transporting ATPase subunit alpha